MERYAIRIVHQYSPTYKESKLFAVVSADNVVYYRWLAKQTITLGSLDWVTASPWNSEFIN